MPNVFRADAGDSGPLPVTAVGGAAQRTTRPLGLKNMRAKRLPVLGVLLSISVPLHAATPNAHTLCDADERPLFSCSIGKKTLSVCASADLSQASGYLKYRFGQSKEKIELVYPEGTGHPREHFRFFHTGAAKSSAEQLSFSVGPVAYSVFVERAAFDFNGSGVLMKLEGKQIAYLSCAQPRPSPDRLHELSRIGLPAAEYEHDEPPRTP